MQINIEHTNIVKAISNREQVMVKGSLHQDKAPRLSIREGLLSDTEMSAATPY